MPTVSDRIAQAVVKAYLEPELEKHFHPDSYGYRPGKSALDAVGVARQRCWRHNWVLHLDLQAFFDTMPHDLLLRAVRQYTDCRWVLLYIEQWLKAPVQLADGTLEPREKSSPQGAVISPLSSNLFLHYTFDRWMAVHHPSIPFERFADDILCHCRSEAQARWAMSKYKRLRRHRRRSEHWIRRMARQDAGLFAHWRLLHRATAEQ
jgi:RNA-directed DNA polymerase